MSNWVQLAVFEQPAAAKMVIAFLRQAGVPFELRGDSPDVLHDNFAMMGVPVDIRILVPEDRLADAREALEASTTPATPETPFRGTVPPEARDDDAMPPRTKYGLFASVLAFVLPFGGGHFYAHHTATGLVIAAGVLACTISLFLARSVQTVGALTGALFTLIVLDAVFGFLAVRRYRARTIPPPPTQRVHGALMIVAAALVGMAMTFR